MIETKIVEFQHAMNNVEILKTKEAYGYYYADLVSILDIVGPILKELGIGYYHTTSITDSGSNMVSTIVFDIDEPASRIVSSSVIPDNTVLAKMNNLMVVGSAITYFRRYHLTTMLGLTTDEDTDAGGKRVKKQSGAGRSVEANSEPEKPNMVAIFDKQIELKNKVQINKLFDMYKPQMNNAEIKAISQLIENKHGNK